LLAWVLRNEDQKEKTGEQEAGKDVGKGFTWQQGAKSGWEIEVYKH
jgi:hypothetical protein